MEMHLSIYLYASTLPQCAHETRGREGKGREGVGRGKASVKCGNRCRVGKTY